MGPSSQWHAYKANLGIAAFESGTRRVKPYVVLIVSGATVVLLASR